MDVNRYIHLFRIGNVIMGMIGGLVAAFMAVGTNLFHSWVNLAIGCVVIGIFICGGNALNDYIDYEIDKTSHPNRPIPSGRMTRKEALVAGSVMLGGSVLVSVTTLDISIMAVVAVAVVLMVAYELALKQKGFVGNVTIAILTGAVFILGGAIVGDWTANIIVATMAALVSVGREISKDIEDMSGDEGRVTLPMSIGVRNAAIVASFFFIAGPVLCLVPLFNHTYGPLFYLVIVALAIFVYCAYIVFTDQHKAQKMAKYAMIIALVSFIFGVFRF